MPLISARPSLGGRIAGQDAHGGGLAGAVGAEEAPDLPFLHPEGNVVDRQHAGELLGQVFDLDHPASLHAFGYVDPQKNTGVFRPCS